MQKEIDELKKKSLDVLRKSQAKNGAIKASLSGSHYSACWLRDGFWVATALKNKEPKRAKSFFQWVLDILKKYEWKIDKMINMPERVMKNEVLHPKFDEDGNEFQEEWGWNQLDSVGIILYGISQLEKQGVRVIRDEKDKEILKKTVVYLENAWRFHAKDNSVWEEEEEIHAASIASMIAGIRGMKDLKIIDNDKIAEEMWEFLETYRKIGEIYVDHGKKEFGADLSTMVIWSVGLVDTKSFLPTVEHLEKYLIGDVGGVKRYLNDQYFEHNGNQGQWTLGALWLSQFYASLYKETKDLEHKNKSLWYLWHMVKAQTPEGYLPEQILSQGAEDVYDTVILPGIRRFGNAVTTPLAWSHAMYLLAVEELAGA